MALSGVASIQVQVDGKTIFVNPTERWVAVGSQLRNAVGKKDATFVYTDMDSSQQVIFADYVWKKAVMSTSCGADGSKILRLMLLTELQPKATPTSTDGCCPPKASSSKSSGCCPSKESPPPCGRSSSSRCSKPAAEPLPEKTERTCTHHLASQFSKPKDAQQTDKPSMEPRKPVPNECQKCDNMFDTFSPVGDGVVPPKVRNPTLDQYKYSGEALRCCQLPLGPLGGGCIAVSGDGGLRQWQVINEVNHTGHVPDSFWGIKVEASGGVSTSRVLQSDALYNDPSFIPAHVITDHVVPPGSIDLLKKLPGVPEIEVTAKYPTVEVDYPNSGLAVDVHMTAYNPCVPLDEIKSGIPALVFQFDVTNPLEEPVQVTLLNSQQNFVGWDGHTPITNGVQNSSYGGNTNSLLQLNDNLTAIDMFNTTLSDPNGQDYDPHDGHFASCVVSQAGDTVSSMLQFDSVEAMWSEFTSAQGLSGAGRPGPSALGRTWNGALALTRTVAAKTTQRFTFFLAWHFPHRVTNWGQPLLGMFKPPFYVGNKYAALYANITTVLKTIHDQLTTLESLTLAFRDCMFNSTLPWQLIDSAAGRISVVRTPTCMWINNGRFLAFEGLNQDAGCCPLNCTHVYNYEQVLANLWPNLEQSMRDVDLGSGKQVTPSGRLLSRCDIPLILRPQWMYFDNYDQDFASTQMCVDGELGAILKLYREVRMGASPSYLATMWPAAKQIMARWLTVNDQGDGTMKIAQPSTYDEALYGVNTFIGALYLCALKAAEKLALLSNEEDLAKTYSDRYALGRQSLEKKCWVNGQWYTQEVDPAHAVQIVGESTFVDCLLGQWWGYILQLGDILPFEHCQSTVQNIYAYNHRDEFIPAEQQPRPFYDQRDAGLVICAWPSGTIPSNRLRYSTECAWTGLSHYFAGLCIYLGETDIGLKVLEDNRYCYDGTRRSPWNEIECGDHYSRPMCAFQLFATASGITWDNLPGLGLRLGFMPRIGPENFAGFYNLPTCWGQYVQTQSVDLMTGTAQITIESGSLVISELWFPFFNDNTEEIIFSVGAGSVAVTVDHVIKEDGYVKITLSKPVGLNADNQFFKVTFGTIA